MKYDGKQILTTVAAVGASLILAAQSLAATAKSGQGNLTASPTSVNTGSTNNFAFSFRAPKNTFNAGSQVTLLIPAGWSAPQTNNSGGPGFVGITPVLSGSTATLDNISGSGPWTLTVNFSTSQKKGGFNADYNSAVAPVNAGIYKFTAQSKQSGSVLKVLKSGSPSMTVNSLVRTNTLVSLDSGLNPSIYGDWVTFTAAVAGTGTGTLSGTITFKNGDDIMSTVPLDAQGRATFSTNRFSVADSPNWITAEYSGNLYYNGSVSPALSQEVSPLALTLSGLTAGSKVYDGGTAAQLDVSHASLGGILAGDVVNADVTSATASFADSNAGTQKVVNAFGLALSGPDFENYVLNPMATVIADITPALLTVIANDTNRLYGAANPPFVASYSGFVAGEGPEVLTGTPALSTPADAASGTAGNPYPIVSAQGTLSAGNYLFAFVPGSLTITPGPDQPQRIISITKLQDGNVAITSTGTIGQSYLLQAASELSANSWATIATNTTDVTGQMTSTDFSATNFPSRFYRTSLP